MQNRKIAGKKKTETSHYSAELLADSFAFVAILWALLWRLLRFMNIVSAPNQLLVDLPKTKLHTDSARTPPLTTKNKRQLALADKASAATHHLQVGAVLPTASLLKYVRAATNAARLKDLLAQEEKTPEKKSPCTSKK